MNKKESEFALIKEKFGFDFVKTESTVENLTKENLKLKAAIARCLRILKVEAIEL